MRVLQYGGAQAFRSGRLPVAQIGQELCNSLLSYSHSVDNWESARKHATLTLKFLVAVSFVLTENRLELSLKYFRPLFWV